MIGNGAYESAPKLDNAVFDAKAVADAFRKLGFEVVDGYDLNIAEMRAKVSEFAAALPDAKSAVIYYAGHGISVDEENYLIPTDIVLRSPTDLDLGSISVSLVLRQMKREDRVNVVILDACRDNPFASALAKAKTRAIVGERGLSRIDGDLARGTLIAFASDPKSTALDGSPGQHSPFTEAFLGHVFDPGVPIDTVMSRVRTEVWEKTRHNQLPWVNTSLIGDYLLNPQPAKDVANAPARGRRFSDATAGPRKTFCGNPPSIRIWAPTIRLISTLSPTASSLRWRRTGSRACKAPLSPPPCKPWKGRRRPNRRRLRKRIGRRKSVRLTRRSRSV